jgi:hypothetical protein
VVERRGSGLRRVHVWNVWTGRCNQCNRLRYENDEVPRECLSEGERRERTAWETAAELAAEVMRRRRNQAGKDD